jgi:hypothetical protein
MSLLGVRDLIRFRIAAFLPSGLRYCATTKMPNVAGSLATCVPATVSPKKVTVMPR